MAKRADLGASRFVRASADYATRYLPLSESLREAAIAGMWKTIDEAEHGGIGIGRATVRSARKNWQRVVEQVERRLGAQLIAEGC